MSQKFTQPHGMGVVTCFHGVVQKNAQGVDFISLSESVDTSTPMGKMVYTVIAAVAELERSLIRERVMWSSFNHEMGF